MKHPDELKGLNEKAELLKSVAHPVRLCIVRGLLDEGEANVGKMQSCLNIPQSTLSQHLAKLRAAGIVRGRREGTEIFYQVASEDIRKLIRALFPKSK